VLTWNRFPVINLLMDPLACHLCGGHSTSIILPARCISTGAFSCSSSAQRGSTEDYFVVSFQCDWWVSFILKLLKRRDDASGCKKRGYPPPPKNGSKKRGYVQKDGRPSGEYQAFFAKPSLIVAITPSPSFARKPARERTQRNAWFWLRNRSRLEVC